MCWLVLKKNRCSNKCFTHLSACCCPYLASLFSIGMILLTGMMTGSLGIGDTLDQAKEKLAAQPDWAAKELFDSGKVTSSHH